jgi:hypothetical protein
MKKKLLVAECEIEVPKYKCVVKYRCSTCCKDPGCCDDGCCDADCSPAGEAEPEETATAPEAQAYGFAPFPPR